MNEYIQDNRHIYHCSMSKHKAGPIKAIGNMEYGVAGLLHV